MRIPIAELSDDAMKKIVEEFILREGTDYGSQEFSLGSKVEQVVKQLKKGDAVLVFDHETESIDIVSPRKAAEMEAGKDS